MMRLVLGMLLLAMIGSIEGARVKPRARVKTLALKELKKEEALKSEQQESKGFDCPNECQECCAASWLKAWIPGNIGRSGDRFKCILKAAYDRNINSHLPKNRKCTAPKKRNRAGGNMAKTECDYTSHEKKIKAWTLPELQQCSSYSECCCDKSEDWTEHVCAALGTNAPGGLTKMKSPSRSTMQTYKKVSQTYSNKGRRCMRGDSVRHAYQTGPNGYRLTQGCCTRVRDRTHQRRYQCGYQWSHNHTHMTERYCYHTTHWTQCIGWEQLYHCSNNGGVTPSGDRFKRISTAKGQCATDTNNAFQKKHLQLDNYKCPHGYTSRPAGEECQCTKGCGDNR